jgi:RimJ/RimL family protein N-acetyltransferase
MTVITGKLVRLRPKHIKDASNDYLWRRDEELSRLDAAIPLSISYGEYLMFYGTELYGGGDDRFRFGVETLDGKHIGNCALYNVDHHKREAELGVMVGDRDYWDKGYGADAVRTLVRHAFATTNLERIHLKTLDWNARAQACFTKCGFTPSGKFMSGPHTFLEMEITRARAASLEKPQESRSRQEAGKREPS